MSVEIRDIACEGRTIRQLLIDGASTMLDTEYLAADRRRAIAGARGDCYVGGLGLGLLAAELAALDRVRSVLVVELDPRVIALVAPLVAHPKVEVVCGDARRDFLGRTFDWIHFDCVTHPAAIAGFIAQALPAARAHLRDGGAIDWWRG